MEEERIEKVEIIVGIPSFNEAENIGFVVKQISKGLKKYFPGKKSLIVNADNNSTDKTGEVFLATRTAVPKTYLATKPELKGKGYNFYNLFKFIEKRSSGVNIVFDADLRSITPEWVKKMATPIIRGHDFVIPSYVRSRRDALITNHFCYPLIYGLLGWNISQPIGGDFSFSSGMVRHWLSKKWTANIYHYGIDIFMVTEAILNDFKICQAGLGRKIHRATGTKLKPMFIEVATTLFNQLVVYKRFWENQNVKKPRIFYEEPFRRPQAADFNYQEFKDVFQLGFKANETIIKKVLTTGNYGLLKEAVESDKKEIDSELWSKIVYDFLRAYDIFKGKNDLIETLETIFLGRLFYYLNSTGKLSFSGAEREILNQAKIFRLNRPDIRTHGKR